jgi:hypothetical protein
MRIVHVHAVQCESSCAVWSSVHGGSYTDLLLLQRSHLTVQLPVWLSTSAMQPAPVHLQHNTGGHRTRAGLARASGAAQFYDGACAAIYICIERVYVHMYMCPCDIQLQHVT